MSRDYYVLHDRPGRPNSTYGPFDEFAALGVIKSALAREGGTALMLKHHARYTVKVEMDRE